jgi:hypothetical protein
LLLLLATYGKGGFDENSMQSLWAAGAQPTYVHSLRNPKRWAVQPGNTNALKHGFYSPRFNGEEIQSLTLFEEHIDAVSEIKMLRVAVDRVISRLGEHCDISECVALLNVLTRAAGRIGHLIRLQKFIYGDQNSVSELLKDMLGEVADELNLV